MDKKEQKEQDAKHQIIQTFENASKNKLTIDELKVFVENIINNNPFFIPHQDLQNGTKNSQKVPICFCDLNKLNFTDVGKTNGVSARGVIQIDTNYLERVVKGEESLFSLINTAAHEYRHCLQHLCSNEYKKKVEKWEKSNQTNYMSVAADKYKQYQIDPKMVDYISKLATNTNLDEHTSNFLAFAIYSEQSYEKDAVINALSFSKKLIAKILKEQEQENLSDETVKYLHSLENLVSIVSKKRISDHNKYDDLIKILDKYVESISLNTLLQANANTADPFADTSFSQVAVINDLIERKTKDLTIDQIAFVCNKAIKMNCYQIPLTLIDTLNKKRSKHGKEVATALEKMVLPALFDHPQFELYQESINLSSTSMAKTWEMAAKMKGIMFALDSKATDAILANGAMKKTNMFKDHEPKEIFENFEDNHQAFLLITKYCKKTIDDIKDDQKLDYATAFELSALKNKFESMKKEVELLQGTYLKNASQINGFAEQKQKTEKQFKEKFDMFDVIEKDLNNKITKHKQDLPSIDISNLSNLDLQHNQDIFLLHQNELLNKFGPQWMQKTTETHGLDLQSLGQRQ